MTETVVSAKTKSRAGAPTTHSIPSTIANSTSAVPRSPWRTTSAVTAPVTGTIGIKACFQSPSTFSLRAYRFAHHRMIASLAISEGCIVNGPIARQLRLPLVVMPRLLGEGEVGARGPVEHAHPLARLDRLG